MFCTKCATDLQDDSQFCRKCGQPQQRGVSVGGGLGVAPAAIPPQPKSNPAVRIPVIVGILLIGFAGWFMSYLNQQARVNAVHQPSIQLHRYTIGTGTLTANPANYTFYPLEVPVGATNVRMQGHFSASGGAGNDVEVFLMNQDEYTNWQNRHATGTFYKSGRVTVGDVNVTLPEGAGKYYLVFNNRFSLFSQKVVAQNITLTYYQ